MHQHLALLIAPIVHHPFEVHLGPITVTGFGIAVVLGFLIGQFVGERELARRGHPNEPVGDVVIGGLVGFLIGAKLYYAVFMGDWGAVFSRGGFVFWGGLMGGIAVAVLVAAFRRAGIARIFDVAGIGIAAGYAVGRTGCWAVGDDYGRPWNSPFAVAFPAGAPPSTARNLEQQFGVDVAAGVSPDTVLAVHPTQLYETALGLVMFFILWRLRGHKHAEGWLFGLYLILGGVERFLIEFLRAKDDRILGPLTVAQGISLALVLVGVAVMAWRWLPRPGSPGIYAAPTPLPRGH
ncbi:MAG: prolipoprotein diacylglyceryl transferase [Gemmatimonadaceae bacterium]